MEVATATQPPSKHQKRYVPTVAGTLEGCGLILVLGCLFYLFWRKRRLAKGTVTSENYGISSYRIEGPIPFEQYPQSPNFGCISQLCLNLADEERRIRLDAEDVFFSSYNDIEATVTGETPLADWRLQYLPSAQGSIPRQPFQHQVPQSSIESIDSIEHVSSDICLDAGVPGVWDSNADLSSLGALTFANVDLETNFDLDHQTPNVSTVPMRPDLEPSRDDEVPFDIDLELGIPVDQDLTANLSGSRALSFASSNLQTKFSFDHQDSSPPDLPVTSDLVPSHEDDFLAWCSIPSSSSQPEMISNSPSAPSASNIEQPNDLTLSPLRTNVEISVSHPSSRAPEKPDSLPLPPAPNLRCPHCPRKFSSRVRLE